MSENTAPYKADFQSTVNPDTGFCVMSIGNLQLELSKDMHTGHYRAWARPLVVNIPLETERLDEAQDRALIYVRERLQAMINTIVDRAHDVRVEHVWRFGEVAK